MLFVRRYWVRAAVLLAISVLAFIASRSGPRLYSGGTTIKGITALISALTGLVTGCVALLGFVDKILGWFSSGPKSGQTRERIAEHRQLSEQDDNGSCWMMMTVTNGS